LIRAPAADSAAGVYSRLRLDEAAYRDPLRRTWVIVPSSSSSPSPFNVIVMGMSTANPNELVHMDRVRDVPIIRRFSGGGTVVVNSDSLLFTIATSLPVCKPFPRDIIAWIGTLFSNALSPLLLSPSWRVTTKENDLVVHDEFKVAGHAQAIAGTRWMHHTSLLWTATPEQMSYLKLPSRRPAYRGDRDHLSFVRGLSEFVSPQVAPQDVIDAVVREAEVGLGGEVATSSELPPWHEPTRNEWLAK
jgi:lipoate-protein ligase A